MMEKSAQAQARPSPSLYVPSQSCGVHSLAAGQLHCPCISTLPLWYSVILPVDEGPLGVHEVELVVEPGPRLHDGRGVGQAAHRSLHLQHHGQMNYEDNEH